MRRFALILAAAAVATLVLGVTTPALGQVPQHRATLTGAKEPHPADRDARGQFTWSLDGNQLCYLLPVTRFRPATAAHIHLGRAGVDNGAVVVPLATPTPASADCVVLAAPLARALRTNPARYYVNVHNAQFPGGGLRSQLG
jgi:hypothetical protein